MAKHSLSILMIDDDREDAFMVKRALKRIDADTDFHHRSDAAEFAEDIDDPDLLLKSLADIFLLDINMPRISGFDILQRMAVRRDFKDVDVIMFSTSDTPEDKSRALDLGALRFCTKPTSLAALTEFAESITGPRI